MFQYVEEILLALVDTLPFFIGVRIIFDFLRSILFRGWNE